MKKRQDLSMYGCTAIASLIAGGLFFNFVYEYIDLPDFMQTAIYLSLTAILMIAVVLLALFCFNGKIMSKRMSERGYLYEYKSRHLRYAIGVSVIFIAVSAIVGGATEALYTFGSESLQKSKIRAGSYIIADFSDTMNENDSKGAMKDAIADYIHSIELTELFGITLFSDEVIIPEKPTNMSDRDYEQAIKAYNGYVYLESDANRENVIELVRNTEYGGLTNTNDALITALRHIRSAESTAEYERLRSDRYYPAEMFLFSDGLPSSPVDYTTMHNLAVGGKIIPISTVFYGSENSEGVETMRYISRITGGMFSYVAPNKLSSVFVDSSSEFKFETPKLMFMVLGPLAQDNLRIAFQWFLLYIWVFISSAAVYNLIGNKELFKEFFIPKLIWSGFLLMVAVGLINADNPVMHTVGRLLVAVSFVVVFPIRNREVRGEVE